MFHNLVDLFQIVPAFLPVDLGAGAQTGDIVSLKNYHVCSILYIQDVGTTDEDVTLTLRQVQTVSGTPKDLVFNKYAIKTLADLSTVGTFTRVTDNNAATLVIAGELQTVVVIEVPVSEMDIAGGYDCIQLTTTDPGTTAVHYGTAIYFLGQPRYGQSILPSAIVN